MRILEVRDDFLKFEVSGNVSLSSFIKVSDGDNVYIGQVVKVKHCGAYSISYAKLLYVYDGEFLPYNIVPISHSSTVSEFSFEEIKKSFVQKAPVPVGNFVGQEQPVALDYYSIAGKLLASVENFNNTEVIINNLKSNMSAYSNVLVIDTIGILKDTEYNASKDFKLLLNEDGLRFLYEDCLNDATSDSKALIKNIFSELFEYIKQVPFLPFSSLKSIVDEMVDKKHEFKLWVLKNKLNKFAQLGHFASNKTEADSLNKILNSEVGTINLSNLDTVFLNRYLETIYSFLSNMDKPPAVIITLSNKINKRNLKNIVLNNKVLATPFITSKYNYINEIKSIYKNFIIEPSFSNNLVFKPYSNFLNAMPKDCFLAISSDTNFLPLIVSADEVHVELTNTDEIDNVDTIEADDTNTITEVVNEDISEASEETPDNNYSTIAHSAEIEVVQKDANTMAIEKKSEDLIDRISEEDDTDLSENIQIFGSDTDTDTDTVDDDALSFNNEQEFHTEADDTKLVKIPEDVSELVNEATEAAEEVEIEELGDEEITNVESEQLNETDSVMLEELQSENQNDIEKDTEEKSEIQDLPQGNEDIIPNEEINSEIQNELNEDISIQVSDKELPDDILLDEIEQENSPNNDAELEQIALDENNDDDLIDSDNSNIASDEQLIDLEETVESDVLDNDEIISLDDDLENLNNDIDQEIVEDVDKVFTTIKDDSISDNDLDFIDELNNELSDELIEDVSATEFETLDVESDLEEDNGFIEPLEEVGNAESEKTIDSDEVLQTKPAETNTLPIYDADIPAEDKVISDEIEQGDLVVHAKYGNGVVEKMIKYGNKTLFSINFDNVGRRLLDPTLTEIKKA